MKQYIAIDHTDPDHHKHPEFDTEAEAQSHINDNLPNGFVALNPGGNSEFWIVDDVAKTVTHDAAGQAAAELATAWAADIAATDATMPRWFEDYIDENGIALAPGRTKDAHANKKNVRARKP